MGGADDSAPLLFYRGDFMKKVLFVCMGNICRSPAADGIFQELLKREGLASQIYVDSAGTHNYHQGSLPDRRMREHGKMRGYDFRHLSRPVDPYSDFEEFDYILGMDDENMSQLKAWSKGKYDDKLYLMTDFCKTIEANYVPDPYYGGDKGFELVLDILEDSCAAFLEKIKAEL